MGMGTGVGGGGGAELGSMRTDSRGWSFWILEISERKPPRGSGKGSFFFFIKMTFIGPEDILALPLQMP